jgi:TolB-like protein
MVIIQAFEEWYPKLQSMVPSEDPEHADLDKYARRVIYSALLRAKILTVISHNATMANKKQKADLKEKADERKVVAPSVMVAEAERGRV